MTDQLVTEWAAVSIVLFAFLVLAFPIVALVLIGTVEGQEARPLEAAVTWMRRHRARHRRGRSIKAQWDVQLAHAGGRYEELPSVAEYDTDTLRLFHELNDEPDVIRAGQGVAYQVRGAYPAPETGEQPPPAGPDHPAAIEAPRTSIFDRLSDTDCFAAINWDIHRAVNELAVLQRDLWAGYKLPPWKKWKR